MNHFFKKSLESLHPETLDHCLKITSACYKNNIVSQNKIWQKYLGITMCQTKVSNVVALFIKNKCDTKMNFKEWNKLELWNNLSSNKYLMNAKYHYNVNTAWTICFRSMLKNWREYNIKQERFNKGVNEERN